MIATRAALADVVRLALDQAYELHCQAAAATEAAAAELIARADTWERLADRAAVALSALQPAGR